MKCKPVSIKILFFLFGIAVLLIIFSEIGIAFLSAHIHKQLLRLRDCSATVGIILLFIIVHREDLRQHGNTGGTVDDKNDKDSF